MQRLIETVGLKYAWDHADQMLLAVFAVAFALRFTFVTVTPQTSVWGDIPAYASIALGMGHFVLYGDVHPYIAQLYFSRGPFLPTLYATAFAAYFAGNLSILHSFESVLNLFDWDLLRHLQMTIDAATCTLVAAIGRRLFGQSVGFLAGILAALYPTAILWVGQPLREVWIGFGLAAFTWVWLESVEHGHWRWSLMAGTLLFFAGQVLPEVIGLSLLVPVVAAWTYLFWREPPTRCTTARAALGTTLACLGWWSARWVLKTALLGRADHVILGEVATGGFWNYMATSGWQPDASQIEQVTLGVAKGAGTVGEIFSNGVVSLLQSPGLWLAVYAQNIHRLWAYPYNIFGQEFPIGWATQIAWHRTAIALSVLFLPLSSWLKPRAILLMLLPLFLSLLYAIEHVETRFVAVSIPLVWVSVGYGAARLTSAILARPSHVLGSTIVGATAGATLALMKTPQWLALFPAVPPLIIHRLWVGGWCAVGGFGLYVAWRSLCKVLPPKALGWSLAVATPLLVAGWLLNTVGSSQWHQWSATLRGPRTHFGFPPERIEQVIEVSAGGVNATRASLLVDMASNDFAGVVIRVNGQIVKPSGTTLPSREKQFDTFYTDWLQITGKTWADLRQWWEVSLPPDLLADSETVTISIWIDEHYSLAWARIYGDYQTNPARPNVFEGPQIGLGPEYTSLYRFRWSLENDPRLVGVTTLASSATHARRFDGQTWRSDDLSSDRGRQLGTYRLRLVVFPADDQVEPLIY